ncbi:MAG: hypothetical protein ACRD2R_00315, partial [Terriglobales bacterium]
MTARSGRLLTALLFPGGALLLAVWVLLRSGLAVFSPGFGEFLAGTVFVAGALLALRFRATRILSGLLVLA